LAPSSGSGVWSGTIILKSHFPVTPSTRLWRAAMALGEVALYLNLSYVHPDPPAVTRGQTIGGEPAGFGGAD
jgi:hypothetical protein